MKSFTVAVVAFVAATSGSAFGQRLHCGVPTNSSNYILGGDDAAPLEFPWQVSLQLANLLGSWSHSCGGAIIDKSWIFTAAHCVDTRLGGSGPMRVLVGAHNITRRDEKLASGHVIDRSRDIYMHPGWDLQLLDYDYALIQLPKPLDFAGKHSHLTPICMPMANESRVFENMRCMTSGWGLTKNSWNPADQPDVLQKLQVRVPPHQDCVRAYRNPYGLDNRVIHLTSRHICGATTRGEGSGPCRGDSGGPLQCKIGGRFVLAGATSFGRYCGSQEYPGVFARVTEVLDWVNQVRAARTRQY